MLTSKKLLIIAGPCAVESEAQLLKTAKAVKKAGATMLRGGAYKPRTSPHSFQGLGEVGLQLLAKAKHETGLPIVTEVMDTRDVELVSQYADVLQIGARNMQNFSLLKEVGRTKKTILLKRGLSATVEEWLLAAEYIKKEGNNDIILCERGVRTFETSTRNTLDLNSVALLKLRGNYTVIVDPSHATGKRELVLPLSKAALATGADGLIIEVHPDPETALSDGPQSLTLPEFTKLMRELAPLAKILNRIL
jgi:3-deoxy-7-phosphoheptulonate synthase